MGPMGLSSFYPEDILIYLKLPEQITFLVVKLLFLIVFYAVVQFWVIPHSSSVIHTTHIFPDYWYSSSQTTKFSSWTTWNEVRLKALNSGPLLHWPVRFFWLLFFFMFWRGPTPFYFSQSIRIKKNLFLL